MTVAPSLPFTNQPIGERHEPRRIFNELVAGVRYIHGEGIIHRDLKVSSWFPCGTLCRCSGVQSD
jgi:serine/threonine protein kinase